MVRSTVWVLSTLLLASPLVQAASDAAPKKPTPQKIKPKLVRKSSAALGSSAAVAAVAAPALAPSAATPAPTTPAPTTVPPLAEPLSTALPADMGLSPELAMLVRQVHLGDLPCELGQTVQLRPDAKEAGLFHLRHQQRHFRMRPVISRTGAIRLEDEKAGAVWLQLSNKSMLMDQKAGRRLADVCVHPEQAVVAQQMQANPPPSLLEPGPAR